MIPQSGKFQSPGKAGLLGFIFLAATFGGFSAFGGPNDIVNIQPPPVCQHQGPLEFRVDTFEDLTDRVVGDCACLTQENNCSLRSAIQEANAYKNGPVTIVAGAGTFLLTLQGPDEDEALYGDLDISAATKITIQGEGEEVTVIDGGTPYVDGFAHPSESSDRVFQILKGVVVIRGVTIQHGYSNVGGGVYVGPTGSLELDRSWVKQNGATLAGGGVEVHLGYLNLHNSVVLGNLSYRGGGVDCSSANEGASQFDSNYGSVYGNDADFGGGVSLKHCKARFVNSRIEGNNPHLEWTKLRQLIPPQGGGLYSTKSDLSLTRTIVSHNLSFYGAGLYLDNEGQPVDIEGGQIQLNFAAFAGGGIFNRGILSLRDNSVDANSITAFGFDALGVGIYNDAGGVIGLSGTTVSNNKGTGYYSDSYGGGIYSKGRITLINSTISSNSANFGGGIYAEGNQGYLTANNVTITKNNAPRSDTGRGGLGGGVSSTGTLSNSIVADNTDESGRGPDCLGTLISDGYNLIGYRVIGECQVLADDNNGDQIGDSNGGVKINPRLGVLAANGGPTKTHALQVGSPAIDRGDPGPTRGMQNAGPHACEPIAQNALMRPQGPRCDIGAYERPPGDPLNGIRLY